MKIENMRFGTRFTFTKTPKHTGTVLFGFFDFIKSEIVYAFE